MQKITPILLLILAGCAGQPPQGRIDISAVPMPTVLRQQGDYLEASLQQRFRTSHIDIVCNQQKGVVILRRQRGSWPERLALRIRHRDAGQPRIFEVDLETSQHFVKVPMYFAELQRKERRRVLALPLYNTSLKWPLQSGTVKTATHSSTKYFEMTIPQKLVRHNPGYLKIRWYQYRPQTQAKPSAKTI